MKRARGDLIGSARALLAFQGVEETPESLLGACITAEHYMMIHAFLTTKPKR
jgi:hypothetical protein